MFQFDVFDWKIPQNLKLADSRFNYSDSIDLLIGVELFWRLMSVGQISFGKGLSVAQKTQLGWIIANPMFIHGCRETD